MLPRKNRLVRNDFPKNSIQGKTFHSEHFFLKITENKEEIPSKFSFIVSKKTAKLAKERNFLKRRARASLIPYLKNIKPSFLGIFHIKKGVETISFSDFKAEIMSLLEKSQLLKA